MLVPANLLLLPGLATHLSLNHLTSEAIRSFANITWLRKGSPCEKRGFLLDIVWNCLDISSPHKGIQSIKTDV